MIDILLATFNGEKYLREQIDSIISQSFQDWKLIIRDDGSTDSTLSIVSEYVKNYPGKIIVVETKNNKKSALYNFWSLVNYSNNEYIMFSDQDDVWLKDKVLNTYKAIRSAEISYGTVPLLVHTDLQVINQSGVKISNSLYKMQNVNPSCFSEFKQLLSQNAITGCTMLFNRHLKEVLLPINDFVIMHDWWIGLHAAFFGHIIYLNTSDVLYRQHQNNTIGAKKVKSLEYVFFKLKNLESIYTNIKNTYYQANTFFNSLEKNRYESNPEFKLLKKYAMLSTKSKLYRIITIIRFGFWKQKISRKVGQILFC